MRPMDYGTIPAIRDAVNAGAVTLFKAYVTAPRLDGTRMADRQRAAASRITYDVQPVDTDEVFDPAALTGLTPHNRSRGDIVVDSAAVGDLVTLVRFGRGTPNQFTYHLYTLTEYEAWVGCDGSFL